MLMVIVGVLIALVIFSKFGGLAYDFVCYVLPSIVAITVLGMFVYHAGAEGFFGVLIIIGVCVVRANMVGKHK